MASSLIFCLFFTGALAGSNYYYTPPPPPPQAPPAPPTFPDTCLCPPAIFPHAGSEYRIYDCPRSFDDSAEECQSWGGDLVKLETKLEAQWLEYIIAQRYGQNVGFWIGLRRFSCNSNLWFWRDNQLTTFTAWDVSSGQPDCKWNNELCAKLYDGWNWDDAPCQLPFRFICERRLTQGAPPQQVAYDIGKKKLK